jgi:hypothetical protein
VQSEVARIREQIAKEYQAAQFVFSGYSEVAKHEFITKRQEALADQFEELKKHLPEDEAMRVFIQMSEQSPN